MNFEKLKDYLASKNLTIGTHCTTIENFQSIKQYGISHGGNLSSTILFAYSNGLDKIKTLKHKNSNCVVIVGIPKSYANFIQKNEKENGSSLFESEEFCELVPPNCNLSNLFVLNPQFIIGVYIPNQDKFELNGKAITEQKNYDKQVELLINKAKIKYLSSKELSL